MRGSYTVDIILFHQLNTYGANLQRKYIAWKNPEIKLTSFKQRTENNQVIVESEIGRASCRERV